jgi:hypothetical protein
MGGTRTKAGVQAHLRQITDPINTGVAVGTIAAVDAAVCGQTLIRGRALRWCLRAQPVDTGKANGAVAAGDAAVAGGTQIGIRAITDDLAFGSGGFGFGLLGRASGTRFQTPRPGLVLFDLRALRIAILRSQPASAAPGQTDPACCDADQGAQHAAPRGPTRKSFRERIKLLAVHGPVVPSRGE